MWYEIIQWILLAALLGFTAWLGWRSFQRSEKRAKLVGKWVVSALLIWFALFILAPHVESGLVFLLVPLLAACGVLLGVIWAPELGEFVSRPLESLFFGGESSDEKALYAIAQAHCKRGRYREAIAEVKTQLASFPQDAEGQLLLARIHAEHLGDLSAAEEAIMGMLSQEGHSPQVMAYALNQLADWRLHLGNDLEGARQALARIQELFPGTELAYQASQRNAHLDPQQLQQLEPTKTYSVPHTEEYIGLRDDFTGLKPVEKSPLEAASELVQRLTLYPSDNEAREQLAIVYARQLQRMDLAVEQIEQLLAQPGVPLRRLAHWHNLLADLQIQCAGNLEAARQALRRLIDSFPRSVEAEKARNRAKFLALELKGQQKSQAIKLGSYEKNMGLKYGRPRRPGA